MSTETIRFIRDGEKGGRGYGGGGRGRLLYLLLHCHHQNTSCVKMGSDESCFNVSLIVWDSHKTASTDHNFLTERRAEADSNRGPSACQPYLTDRPNQLTPH